VNGRNHLVGGAEVVAAGLFRVGAPIGEDDAGIARLHDASALRVVRNQPGKRSIAQNKFRVNLGRTHEIVGAHLVNAEFLVLLDECWKSGHDGSWRAVHSLK